MEETFHAGAKDPEKHTGPVHDPSSQELILLPAPTLLALLPLVIVTDATERDGDIQSTSSLTGPVLLVACLLGDLEDGQCCEKQPFCAREIQPPSSLGEDMASPVSALLGPSSPTWITLGAPGSSSTSTGIGVSPQHHQFLTPSNPASDETSLCPCAVWEAGDGKSRWTRHPNREIHGVYFPQASLAPPMPTPMLSAHIHNTAL